MENAWRARGHCMYVMRYLRGVGIQVAKCLEIPSACPVRLCRERITAIRYHEGKSRQIEKKTRLWDEVGEFDDTRAVLERLLSFHDV